MTDRLREAAQAALDDLEARCGTNAPERGPDGSITKLRAALAEQTVKDSLTTQPSIIDSIADNLVGDHIALMNENRMLRAALAEQVSMNRKSIEREGYEMADAMLKARGA